MSETIKKVLVLGGLGNLGPYLVKALKGSGLQGSGLQGSGFQVSVLSRSSTLSSAPGYDDVPVLLSDYTFDSLVSVFRGHDAVISAVATADTASQRVIIDAAVAAKVRRFIPSEFGTDTSNPEAWKLAPFLREKSEVLEYLRSKESHEFTWTVIYTGIWIDWILREYRGFLAFDVYENKGTLIGSGNEHFTATTVAKVARATAAVLVHAQETKNSHVHVASFDLTQNRVLTTLEKLSGTAFSMDNQSLADINASASESSENGQWQEAYRDLVTATVYSGSSAIHFPALTEKWKVVLGLDYQEDFEETIKDVLKIAHKG